MIRSIHMYFLLVAFVLGDTVIVLAQDHEGEFATEMEQRRMNVQTMLEEFERETERRRQEEGENFDEETAQFERSMMERQAQLEIDQIALDEEFHQRRLDLDRQYQDLERERQDFWASRQRQDIENRRQDFEQEMERRREEEGENFDEETAQFERSMMERQIALDEQRMAIDEEFNNRRQELGNSQRGQDPSEWERLDREQQQRFEDLDRQYQDLERERQDFWASRQRQDIEYQRADFDPEEHTEDWTSGPNSLSLIVDSVEGDEVVIRIEIADSDPINGWGLQLDYDNRELEFNQFIPGGFIGGSFIPLFKENDDGVQVGGAQLGGQGGMSDGNGVLGSVKLKVIGSLPTWINASSLDLKGNLENEINLTNSQIEIER